MGSISLLRKQRFVKSPSPIASEDYSDSRLAADAFFVGHRARSLGRYREGAGMTRACEHRDDADLRPPQDPAGGQPDVQGKLLVFNCIS
jgi:hypothetical protein